MAAMLGEVGSGGDPDRRADESASSTITALP